MLSIKAVFFTSVGTVFCSGFQYRTQRVPELIPKPTVAQLLDETTTRRVYIYGIQDDNGTDVQNFSLDLTPPPDVIMKTSPGTSEGMNVLGIVIFSATMGKRVAGAVMLALCGAHTSGFGSHPRTFPSPPLGIMLGRMGPNGSALVNFCQSLNEAVLKIVAIVIW